MEKKFLEKVPGHASVDYDVARIITKYKRMNLNFDGIFYDMDTHAIIGVSCPSSTVSVKKEEKPEIVTLDGKDAENLLNQNTKTVLKKLDKISSKQDLAILLESEKNNRNRKGIVSELKKKLVETGN